MKLVPRSVRTQVTLGVAALVMLVVALAGLVITLRIDHREREDVDRQLVVLAGKVQQDVDKLLTPGDRADGYGGLADNEPLIRLLSADQVLAERGARPPAEFPIPASDGYSTVVVSGQTWRSLVQPLTGSTERLQVLQNMDSLEHRLADNRSIAITVAIAGSALAAVGVWVIVGLVLVPLQRLRTGARRILPGDVDQRLPMVDRPQEVADLSATLNGMLERLQASMLATRRFTADAGHELRTPLTSLGMDLETLLRNSGLPEQDRQRMLSAMAVEHRRIVTLLDGLQALARGDAGALPAHGPVELTELADEAITQARRRHGDVAFSMETTNEAVVIEGWRAGLRLALDNLLDNAALHGRPKGTVTVSVWRGDRGAVVSVADDGPGIPPERRADMKQRFTRGDRPRSSGSGLGLALVDQQAQLHGGSFDLGQSPAGGLLATLILPNS